MGNDQLLSRSWKRLSVLFLSLSLLFTHPLLAQTRTTVQSGDWNDAATWDTGVPISDDDVVISNGHTVTLQGDSECTNLTINGILNTNGHNFTMHGSNWAHNGSLVNTSGSVTLTAGEASLNLSGNSTDITFNDLIVDPTFGNSFTFSMDVIVGGDMTLDGDLTLNGGKLQLLGGLNVQAGYVLAASNGGHIEFAGTTQSISGITLASPTCKAVVASGTTLNSGVELNLGSYDIQGTLDMGINNFDFDDTLNVDGILSGDGSTFEWSMVPSSGLMSGTGNVNSSGSNCTFQIPGNVQVPSGSNLTFGSGVTFEILTIANIDNAGTLTLNGPFVQSATGATLTNLEGSNLILNNTITITNANNLNFTVFSNNTVTYGNGSGGNIITSDYTNLVIDNGTHLLQGAVTVESSLTTNASGTLGMNGQTLTLEAANFVNNGSVDAPTSSLLVWNPYGSEVISGNALQLEDLQLGGAFDDATFATDVTVLGDLEMATTNDYRIDGGATLTIGGSTADVGSFTATQSGKFIGGTFRRWINATGNVYYPIATTDNNIDLTLTFNTLTDGGLMAVNFVEGHPGDPSPSVTDGGLVLSRVYQYGYFNFDDTADPITSAGANFTFTMGTDLNFGADVIDADTRIILKDNDDVNWRVDGTHSFSSSIRRSAITYSNINFPLQVAYGIDITSDQSDFYLMDFGNQQFSQFDIGNAGVYLTGPFGTGTGLRPIVRDFGTGTLYSSESGSVNFGTVSESDGSFTPVNALSDINGSNGITSPDRIVDMGQDPFSGEMWALHTEGAYDSYIFKIDQGTGDVVAGAFGGDDYLYNSLAPSNWQ